MRVITLNVNGIRSAAAKGLFPWLASQNADVICLQEVRATEAQLVGHNVALPGYHAAYYSATRAGYAGVALFSRQAPLRLVRGIGIDEFDQEGRYLEAQFPHVAIVSVYLPSGSSGPAPPGVQGTISEGVSAAPACAQAQATPVHPVR